MKKTYKIAIVVLIIFVIMFVGISIFYYRSKKLEDKLVDVTVTSWNDLTKEYIIAKIDGETDSVKYKCNAWFETDSKIDDIVKDNKDYIGLYDYHCYNESIDSYLFYKDNNYYVIYKTDEKRYEVKNLYSDITIHNIMYVPTPMRINVDVTLEDDKVTLCDDVADEIGYFFDNFTYDDAKEFYSKIDEKIINVNDDKKTIKVNGYAVQKDDYVEDAFVIDFNNKTIVINDLDGTKVECGED